jgi:hypothetical protein
MKETLKKPVDSTANDNWLDLYGECTTGSHCGHDCGLDW